jgi:hypothetical protein
MHAYCDRCGFCIGAACIVLARARKDKPLLGGPEIRTTYSIGRIVVLQQVDEVSFFVSFLKGDPAVMQLCVQLGNFEGVAGGAKSERTASREGTAWSALVCHDGGCVV